jgi:uncharacterized membrane protein YebE (DUF533 family)
MNRGKWVVRAISLPRDLDKLVEEVKNKLGMTRSNLYLTAIMEYLRSLSLLSSTLKVTDQHPR